MPMTRLLRNRVSRILLSEVRPRGSGCLAAPTTALGAGGLSSEPGRGIGSTCSWDTDVVLDAGSGNTATGHVVLDLAAEKGTADFSGGTGTFAGFQAHADVSTDADGLWHWEGTYNFD